MVMKKKVLVIPSWYPTKENKFIGNNYPLQLNLTNDDFEPFVLFGRAKKRGVIKTFYFFLFKINQTFEIQVPPVGTGFYYPQLDYIRWLNKCNSVNLVIEKLNYKLMSKFYYYQFVKLLNRGWTPDLIHSFSSINGGIVGFYLSMKTKIPYVLSEHQVFLLYQHSKYKIDLLRKSFIYANKVIAVSEHQKRQILMNYIDCKPIVLGNFIDDKLFFYNSKDNVVFTILVVTYDSFIKDNATLFKAIRELIKRNICDFKVKIIGGNFKGEKVNDKDNPLFKYLEEFDLTHYVELIGFVSKTEMWRYYQKADVLISTSIAETFGMAQCEALMSGIPVISTSNGGIDDMINSFNGIKVELQDYKQIANAIIKVKNKEIIFNPKLIRGSVKNKYGRENFSKRITEIYTDAMKSNA